ncbi:unnamed protein product [Closterium sp. NIES-53]
MRFPVLLSLLLALSHAALPAVLAQNQVYDYVGPAARGNGGAYGGAGGYGVGGGGNNGGATGGPGGNRWGAGGGAGMGGGMGGMGAGAGAGAGTGPVNGAGFPAMGTGAGGGWVQGEGGNAGGGNPAGPWGAGGFGPGGAAGGGMGGAGGGGMGGAGGGGMGGPGGGGMGGAGMQEGVMANGGPTGLAGQQAYVQAQLELLREQGHGPLPGMGADFRTFPPVTAEACLPLVNEFVERMMADLPKGLDIHDRKQEPIKDLLFFLHVPRTGGRTYHQCFLKPLFPVSLRCPRSYDELRFDPS